MSKWGFVSSGVCYSVYLPSFGADNSNEMNLRRHGDTILSPSGFVKYDKKKDKVSRCERNGVYFTNPHLA